MPDVEPCLPWIKPGWTGVEIGVDGGSSACRLLRHGIAFLYMIDPWENYERYPGDVSRGGDRTMYDAHISVSEFPGQAQLIRDSSAGAVVLIPEVDFVWIDGDHRYEWIKSDLEYYWPKVRSGGILCGHDYYNDGGGIMVKRAVDEFAARISRMVEVATVDWTAPCWIIKKDQ